MGDKLFAHHGDYGHLHIETRPVDNRWEWRVIDTKTRQVVNTGIAESMEVAQSDAENAAGGKVDNWRAIVQEK